MRRACPAPRHRGAANASPSPRGRRKPVGKRRKEFASGKGPSGPSARARASPRRDENSPGQGSRFAPQNRSRRSKEAESRDSQRAPPLHEPHAVTPASPSARLAGRKTGVTAGAGARSVPERSAAGLMRHRSSRCARLKYSCRCGRGPSARRPPLREARRGGHDGMLVQRSRPPVCPAPGPFLRSLNPAGWPRSTHRHANTPSLSPGIYGP